MRRGTFHVVAAAVLIGGAVATAVASAAAEPPPPLPPPSPPPQATLRIEVTDLRSTRGELRLGIFNRSSGFPESRDAAVTWRSLPAATNERVMVVTLPPGEYAAVVLHDENGNMKLDRSWGVPREGYGVTNNPKPRLRAATYAEARFNLPPDGASRTISIQYFQ
ncbi:MAG TPA: DUF2141 domain-containing protein [Tepidisphaeraceae bacterium]|nr:DUF2141 domain-containing protein [Tepidisphaeraceae bacterium]